MSGLREEYSVNDIYIVKFNDNYKEYLNKKLEFSELTLNTNLYYIVEKFSYENESRNTYSESYKECVGGVEIFEVRSNKKIQDIPSIFSEIYPFPEEYLTNDEKKSKMISSNRLFYISLDINISLFSKDETKEKTLFVKTLKK